MHRRLGALLGILALTMAVLAAPTSTAEQPADGIEASGCPWLDLGPLSGGSGCLESFTAQESAQSIELPERPFASLERLGLFDGSPLLESQEPSTGYDPAWTPPPRQPCDAHVAEAASPCVSWSHRVDQGGTDIGSFVEHDPATGLVAIGGTGLAEDATHEAAFAFLVSVHDPATGETVWERVWQPSASLAHVLTAFDVHDGTVFVAGSGFLEDTEQGLDASYAAFDLQTGDVEWTDTFAGPASFDDIPTTVSWGSSSAMVAGASIDPDLKSKQINGFNVTYPVNDAFAVSHDASTGSRLQQGILDVGESDVPRAIAASSLVVETREDQLDPSSEEIVLAEFQPEMEDLTVSERVPIPGSVGLVEATPTGDTTFVTARDGQVVDQLLAVDVASGDVLWNRPTPREGFELEAMETDAAGDALAITGTVRALSEDGAACAILFSPSNCTAVATRDYGTALFEAEEGKLQWFARYDGPGDAYQAGYSVFTRSIDVPADVSFAPGGETVYVTGASQSIGRWLDYATVGYQAEDGELLGVARYDGPALAPGQPITGHAVGTLAQDVPNAITAGPEHVYITGASLGKDKVFLEPSTGRIEYQIDTDALTVAHPADLQPAIPSTALG